MSRNAIGHKDNGKVPRLETVLLSLREVLVIEDQLTSARPQTEVVKFSRTLQTQYNNYDYHTPESR